MLRALAGTRRALHLALATLFLLGVFVVLLNANMRKGVSHDENMYIAAGVLPARDALLPYRDFPFLQMPNLELAYAALFKGTGYLLFAARLFSTLCAWLLLILLFGISWRLFSGRDYLISLLAGGGSAILLAANPLFIYTSGLAWNHDLPVLLAFAACLLLNAEWRPGVTSQGSTSEGRKQEAESSVLPTPNPRSLTPFARHSGRWVFFSGLALGLATGARLAFAPLVLPFLGAIFWNTKWGLGARDRGAVDKHHALRFTFHVSHYSPFAWFTLGLLLALLPSLLLFTLAPSRFVFGNLSYHQLNTSYWQATGYERAMALPGKLSYLRDIACEPGNLVLLMAFLALVAWVVIRGRMRVSFDLVFILILLPFLLAGALAPTPTWYQYFYTLVPFLVLGILHAVALLQDRPREANLSLGILVMAVAIAAIYGFPRYRPPGGLGSPGDWAAIDAHELGLDIEAAIGRGRVLTLSPLFPLEGGLDIYQGLAAGAFTWRSAPLLSARDRKEQGIISGDELDALLSAQPPRAILVGFEAGLDDPLVNYAKKNGFRPVALPGDPNVTLWISPYAVPPANGTKGRR